jgi:hypothetical protein
MEVSFWLMLGFADLEFRIIPFSNSFALWNLVFYSEVLAGF